MCAVLDLARFVRFTMSVFAHTQELEALKDRLETQEVTWKINLTDAQKEAEQSKLEVRPPPREESSSVAIKDGPNFASQVVVVQKVVCPITIQNLLNARSFPNLRFWKSGDSNPQVLRMTSGTAEVSRQTLLRVASV